MLIDSDYSITQLFLTKTITISIREDETAVAQTFQMVFPTVREMINNKHYIIVYQLLTTYKLQEVFHAEDKSDLTVLKSFLLEFGKYDKFRVLYDLCMSEIPKVLPGFTANFNEKELKINDITITDDIWDYVLYLLKLNSGEKVQKPVLFDSEEARQFYLAQRAQEIKMQRIRQKNGKKDENGDGLMKIMLSIVYSFPSLNFEYLFDQTMAQILWLQKKAAGAVNYEVNAKAYAAGNVKKGKKLDFFIK